MTTEATQVIGTLAAVYGWGVAPIGWEYALGIWGYSLVWFCINNAVKVFAYRLICHRVPPVARHLSRIHGWLHPHRH
ncbi:MAG: hypothetical protein VW338_08695 [Rhodospirillaceae bacterium]